MFSKCIKSNCNYILNFYSRRSQLTTCCTTPVVSCGSKRIFWGKKSFWLVLSLSFSVLGGSRLLSKVSLKRKNIVGDNQNKYFHITVKIISRFLLFQDRIWGRKARPKSHLSPPPPPTPFPFPPTVRVTPLFLAGTKSIFWHYRSRRRLVQRGEDPHSWDNKDCVGRVRR